MLGTVSGIVTSLNYHIKQSDIAPLLGAKQQEVSRWITGSAEPLSRSRLNWQAMVREYMTRCVLMPDHDHTLDMYRQNVHAGRRKAQ